MRKILCVYFYFWLVTAYAGGLDLQSLFNDSRPARSPSETLALLSVRDPQGYDIVTKLKNRDSMAIFASVPAVYVHECSHMLDIQLSKPGEHCFYMSPSSTISVPILKLMPRKVAGFFLSNDEKVMGYYSTYLVEAGSEQGFEMLLEEFNAYSLDLNTSVCCRTDAGNTKTSARDGTVFFMRCIETYLQALRQNPERWQRLYSERSYLVAIQNIWWRAERNLRLALPFDDLGISDGPILTSVYRQENLQHIIDTFANGGVTFSYQKP